jgi:hypothetical protein
MISLRQVACMLSMLYECILADYKLFMTSSLLTL